MKHTEADSEYTDLEKLDTKALLRGILEENSKVISAIDKALPCIEKVIEKCYIRLTNGGRLFYIGAGTSGRLGIVDASECLPTFGLDNVILGIIAGGDIAIRKAVEFAEDDTGQAWIDLQKYHIQEQDTVVGISASGKTPYVLGGLKRAKSEGIYTVGLVCNINTPIHLIADDTIEVLTGAEFISGSTRMKAGTAQKIVLNMISTSLMIKLGRVKGNKMIDMQLTNQKLIDRGVRMVMEFLKIPHEEAKKLLLEHGSVRKVLELYKP
ncbi:MAG: N-acetylmuramic acid 6-phosphate etherase [Bacteroidia bacterium]|nr:N-acetylmuramic acid 6-phosphate etherase [Bacteroidia bacterium]MDW8348430.1 N-acetylmuramic acid 6-phosphate etherase [Bacteroidia bacterium]